MNNPVKALFAICFLLISACRNNENQAKEKPISPSNAAIQKDYISLIISLDTLRSIKFKKIIFKEDSLFNSSHNKEANPFYHYFKARKYILEKKVDSALLQYQMMHARGTDSDVDLLRTYGILSQEMGNGSIEAALTSQIFAALKKSEQANSCLTYCFYDLLAQAYFQNGNGKKSLEYAVMHFNHHPFKDHPIIKQRYFDISFLLASMPSDFKKMKFYNTQARQLAAKLGDSLAIARTYDNEARIYGKQGKTDQALVSSKIYFNYLKKIKNLNDIAFNNLATAFIQDGQPDSAIRYFKEGIALEKHDLSGKRKNIYYNGLIEAYKMKRDFAGALQAADSAYTIGLRNNMAIEAVKVAEMHEKYEAEKKDLNIAELNSRNKLNETIIKQQRWTLFLIILIFFGGLSFFFVIYRQQRLKAKNNLLKSENQRLNIEQKLLQAQLNPHFIFNAIANLQGLVASGQIEDSVRYLKSFSSLLRGILEQNRKDFIELDEEITLLNNYIQLQQMRYARAFDYQIKVDDGLDLNETMIPPMLIQPFVENAIEHGFRNLTYKGFLNITFKNSDNMLHIEVEDNGSGLTKKATDQQKRQSLAQIILKERFEVLFTSQGPQARFEVVDQKTKGAKGVLVTVKIPMIKD